MAFTGLGKLGAKGTAGNTDGYAGWHQDMTLRQIHESTYLAPDAVLRAHGLGAKRKGALTSQGIVQARKALQQVRSARTLLPLDTRVVVIGLDILGSLSSINIAELVTLGLVGASRLNNPQGEVIPPTVIDHDGRLYAIFSIIPDGSSLADGSAADGSTAADSLFIEVSVVTEPDIQLAAVIGSSATEQDVIKRLITTDLEALFKPDDVIEPVTSSLRWRDPENPRGIGSDQRSINRNNRKRIIRRLRGRQA